MQNQSFNLILDSNFERPSVFEVQRIGFRDVTLIDRIEFIHKLLNVGENLELYDPDLDLSYFIPDGLSNEPKISVRYHVTHQNGLLRQPRGQAALRLSNTVYCRNLKSTSVGSDFFYLQCKYLNGDKSVAVDILRSCVTLFNETPQGKEWNLVNIPDYLRIYWDGDVVKVQIMKPYIRTKLGFTETRDLDIAYMALRTLDAEVLSEALVGISNIQLLKVIDNYAECSKTG